MRGGRRIMVCPICGVGKDEPHQITCDSCQKDSRCEYCKTGYKNINIGKLLGQGDRWGCNSCYDKLLEKAND